MPMRGSKTELFSWAMSVVLHCHDAHTVAPGEAKGEQKGHRCEGEDCLEGSRHRKVIAKKSEFAEAASKDRSSTPFATLLPALVRL